MPQRLEEIINEKILRNPDVPVTNLFAYCSVIAHLYISESAFNLNLDKATLPSSIIFHDLVNIPNSIQRLFKLSR